MVKRESDTDVVRFTTFFYHFTLIFNNLEKKICGLVRYGASFSRSARSFAKEKGYRLRAEDIVDEGYTTQHSAPSKAYFRLYRLHSSICCQRSQKN